MIIKTKKLSRLLHFFEWKFNAGFGHVFTSLVTDPDCLVIGGTSTYLAVARTSSCLAVSRTFICLAVAMTSNCLAMGWTFNCLAVLGLQL